MKTLLALQLPGDKTIDSPTPQFSSLGDLISGLARVGLYITLVLMIAWLVWGIFDYLFASGDKESLGKARARITHAIIGFLIVTLAFALTEYAKTIFPEVNNFLKGNNITPVSPP
ncbi:hypothetical protein HY389_02205 [Candidatus Daviesbacteria bacterium]|nr:hypothetical protein [Candidatus Daviesbacteria bacterium]